MDLLNEGQRIRGLAAAALDEQAGPRLGLDPVAAAGPWLHAHDAVSVVENDRARGTHQVISSMAATVAIALGQVNP